MQKLCCSLREFTQAIQWFTTATADGNRVVGAWPDAHALSEASDRVEATLEPVRHLSAANCSAGMRAALLGALFVVASPPDRVRAHRWQPGDTITADQMRQLNAAAEILEAATDSGQDAPPTKQPAEERDGLVSHSSYRIHGRLLENLSDQDIKILCFLHKHNWKVTHDELARHLYGITASDAGKALTMAVDRLSGDLATVGMRISSAKKHYSLIPRE